MKQLQKFASDLLYLIYTLVMNEVMAHNEVMEHETRWLAEAKEKYPGVDKERLLKSARIGTWVVTIGVALMLTVMLLSTISPHDVQTLGQHLQPVP